MIGYLEWGQRVATAALVERSRSQPLTVGELAIDLGLLSEGESDDQARRILGPILRDLAVQGFIEISPGAYSVEVPPTARRFRVEPLSSTWALMAQGFLEPDDERFLGALATLSEEPGERSATVVEVKVAEVFDRLDWSWDRDRELRILKSLTEPQLVVSRIYGGDGMGDIARITYAGLVRATDRTADALREARDHLQAKHFRAAGAVAAVALERRLQEITGPIDAGKGGRTTPSLDDYAQAARTKRLIEQEELASLRELAAIRKRCVHVLDRDPTSDDVQTLIDGVEAFLRRHPVQA